ncbi:DUF2635 domain-containing protein [Ferrovibrio terrae]|uniref:DUF2635 domain-containing protein n=1 Tax=Ferrovibrio terrae TaxID=2594003 RepID=UPI0031377E65
MEPNKILVKPKPADARVLDPDSMPLQQLPAEGKEVIDSVHWRRCERRGEVEITPVKKKGK